MAENILSRLFGSLAIIIFLSATSRAVVISTVPVGYAGNAPDTGEPARSMARCRTTIKSAPMM